MLAKGFNIKALSEKYRVRMLNSTLESSTASDKPVNNIVPKNLILEKTVHWGVTAFYEKNHTPSLNAPKKITSQKSREAVIQSSNSPWPSI